MPRPRSWPRSPSLPRRATKPLQSASAEAPGRASARRRRCRRSGPWRSCRASARADHVAAAQLGRVQAQLARRCVDQPLETVDRLGPPGAAVGAGRRGVRQHRGEARSESSGCRRRWSRPGADSSWIASRRVARIAAHVGQGAARKRQHLALGVEGEFRLASSCRGRAARRGSRPSASPPISPGARPASPRRRPRHPPGRGRSSSRSRRRRRRPARAPARARCPAPPWRPVAGPRRHLRAHADGDAVGAAIVFRHHHARLHRDRREALVHQVERDDMRAPSRRRPRSRPHRRSASRRRCCRCRRPDQRRARRRGGAARPVTEGSSS